MAQTQINLDDEALEQAKERLGTHSKVDTVNTALRLAAEVGPRPRRRYVPTRELKAALAELPNVGFDEFDELRAEADTASDDGLEAEEAHLGALLANTTDPAWHTR
ncbi:type II toxin-antitoxin system VapB family antitoxin [Haloactinomyces albus]|uniref:Arc/MetJ family transcription regulator n=1 Tax=Haloactinomyces albus TaxID=1352928 RepID=A0AAE3ZEB7_9ACTN|nr:type II toxin-antitoxin system VapB family antitoxin [Haloactinomyces albus]MDR7303347.1 Arc/MetJ family transcription regulator [Haloactinomyces albus]